MNVVARTASFALDLLPADEARQALLPPVRVLREVAVAVAATVRHWELALEGGHDQREQARDEQVAHPPAPRSAADLVVDEETATTPAEVGDGSWDDIGGTPVTATSDDTVDDRPAALDADSLPVPDWPQLSFADAQARLHEVDSDGLRDLIAYERQHGHRVQYRLLLEQRLHALTAPTDA
jgi:hypothetical protein